MHLPSKRSLQAHGPPKRPSSTWCVAQPLLLPVSLETDIRVQLDKVRQGQFYIICPDNEVDWETDRKRIAWAAGDLTEGRPALSRWHPDHAEAFRRFLGG